jgi:predicted outer membrane protein
MKKLNSTLNKGLALLCACFAITANAGDESVAMNVAEEQRAQAAVEAAMAETIEIEAAKSTGGGSGNRPPCCG